MHVKRGWLWAMVTMVCLTVAPQAGIAANAWFGGGTHDGYYGVRGGVAPEFPQVNNAVGATNVTSADARLTGMLVATGSAPAKVGVYWAREDGGTDPAAWAAAEGAGTHVFGDFGEVALFALLSHEIPVDPGSDYYYRFYATNELGRTGWALETAFFQTPGPPAVSTGPGAFPGMTVAGLNGELSAGLEAEIEIHWGQTVPGEPPDSWAVIELGTVPRDGTFENPNSFAENISGLLPDTGYAYRILADNPYGSADTDWVWFSTFPSEPEDFSPAHGQTAWYGGGESDGYSLWTRKESALPGGMFMLFR